MLNAVEVSSCQISRRLPVGAEVLPNGGVHFRVWAPRRRRVDVVLEGKMTTAGGGNDSLIYELAQEPAGYYSGFVASATAGTLYRYRLDGGEAYPDPVSRFQPYGPYGPSQVVDAEMFRWTDQQWRGIRLEGQVIYEMHVGTFTAAGTWDAAARELRELASAGITVVEVMPVADFSGRWGWGYDGVDMFAPTRLYGTPDDFRRFVDRAHAVGLGVILDVVYNHLGPDAAYLKEFADFYFTDRYENEWGAALNFDGEHCEPVREFFIANAGYWVDEFHIDGLRLDATQQIFDASPVHVLQEITQRVREAARGRATVVIAENEPQDVKLVRSVDKNGYGMDALWNDDFHHSAIVAVAGHNEAYYTDYLGTPQEFISAIKWGYLYQGQRYRWQNQRRGTPTFGLPHSAFVNYIQNHDQIANSAFGTRLHFLTSPGRYRAITALLLLAPQTPMLFMGQEFAASSPFLFFADHPEDLAVQVRKGRAEFVSQFRSLATVEVQQRLIDPNDPATFERCKLDLSERQSHGQAYALHKDLLRLRREDEVLRNRHTGALEGAVLGPEAFVLRFFADSGKDRILIVNFGRDLHLYPAPEPLLAPPQGMRWETLWSSEEPRYGGTGTPQMETDEGWRIPGHAACALVPVAG